IWTGGHFTEPYEQKTQHSSALGRSIARQRAHSWKYRQASSGMVSSRAKPQKGQVRVDSSRGLDDFNAGARLWLMIFSVNTWGGPVMPFGIRASALPLLLLCAMACAQSGGPRTLAELKADVQERADRHAYPVSELEPAEVKEALAGLKSLDRDEWA